MPDELVWLCAEATDEALAELARAAEEVRVAYRGAEHEVKANGVSVGDVLAQRGVGDRRRLEGSIRVAQASIRRLRGHVVRTLVEEEGMTITRVAQLMGISRQAVSALYQEAINE